MKTVATLNQLRSLLLSPGRRETGAYNWVVDAWRGAHSPESYELRDLRWKLESFRAEESPVERSVVVVAGSRGAVVKNKEPSKERFSPKWSRGKKRMRGARGRRDFKWHKRGKAKRWRERIQAEARFVAASNPGPLRPNPGPVPSHSIPSRPTLQQLAARNQSSLGSGGKDRLWVGGSSRSRVAWGEGIVPTQRFVAETPVVTQLPRAPRSTDLCVRCERPRPQWGVYHDGFTAWCSNEEW